MSKAAAGTSCWSGEGSGLNPPPGKGIKRAEAKPALQSPFVSMAVTEAGVEEREVVAEVLSRAGLATPSSALAAAAARAGSARGLLWPCRLWPQMRWCRSQSLCWQKEPQ